MMLPKTLLPLAAAQVALAQTLADVLSAQNSTLSTLASLLQRQPDRLSAVAGLSNITVLAPSNEAFDTLLSDPVIATAVQNNPDIVPALLSYHVINGTYYAGNLTSAPDPVLLPTFLTDKAFSTVSGGQRVEVRGNKNGVSIYSGGGAESKVSRTDFNFTGGTLHIIDRVLSIPSNLTTVLASTSDLSSLTTAVTTAGLAGPLDSIEQVTIFAPNNKAFEAISNVVADLSAQQLTAVLRHHVVEGAVVYSSNITDRVSAETLQGETLKLTVRGGEIYVNQARILQPNVLVKNGVVHVIDSVLIPKNLTAGSDNTSTTTTFGVTPTASSTSAPSSTIAPSMAAGTGVASFGLVLAAGVLAVLLQF